MSNHPILPAGYNADDNDGDEVDGAGTNWTIWPVLFDAFIPLHVFILTPEMLAVFDGCPDYIVPWADNSLTIPGEDGLLVPTGIWVDAIVVHVNSTLTVPAEDDLVEVTDRWDEYVIPSFARLGG